MNELRLSNGNIKKTTVYQWVEFIFKMQNKWKMLRQIQKLAVPTLFDNWLSFHYISLDKFTSSKRSLIGVNGMDNLPVYK